MADNFTTNAGSGGDTFAADDIGGVKWQEIKVAFGADGTATLVTSSVGLPVGDAGGSLTVDNAGTFAVQVSGDALTALQLIDDPIATDGSAAAAKLMQVGGTDGSNAQILSVNSSGHLNIADGSNSITVDNGGTFVTQENGAALTALQLIDDTVFVDDAAFTPATSKILMVGAEYDDSATDSVDEGDAGAMRMSGNRNLYTQIRDAAGNERGVSVTAANALKVDASAVAVPVTDNSGSLTVDNAGTFAVQVDGAALTALQLIDDIVFVDDAAFTAAVSKVAMVGATFDDSGTDSVDEGDAGALRMSANRNLYMQIRDGQANERSAYVTSGNALKVDASSVAVPVTDNSGSLTVDNAGTFATQVDGAALTALQLIDNPVFVDDAAFTPATSSVMMIGAMLDDTLPDSVDEGDAGAVRMSANRALHVVVRDAAGNNRGLNVTSGGAIAVDASGTAVPVTDNSGSLTVDNGGTFVIQENGAALTALQLLDDSVATDGAAATTKLLQVGGTDGTNAQILSVTTGGLLNVADGAGSLTVDNGGTFVVQENGAALTALQLIDNVVFVDDVAFTAATSSTLMIGAFADMSGADSVDEGDVGALRMTLNRNLLVSIRDAAGNERGLNVDASGFIGITDGAGSLTVDNAGTFAVQVSGDALTALQLIDDVIFADDAAFSAGTSKVAMIGFTFDDSSPDSVNEGDAGAARMSANRNVYTTIRDANGNERGVNVTASGALQVDGSAVTQPVSGSLSIAVNLATVSVTPTVTTYPYASGDNIAGKQTLSSVVQTSGGSSVLETVVVVDQSGQNAPLDLVFFNADPSVTTMTDQAALDVADADMTKIIGHVRVNDSDYIDFADNSVATVRGVNLSFVIPTGTTAYLGIVSRGTPMYAATSDLRILLTLRRN